VYKYSGPIFSFFLKKRNKSTPFPFLQLNSAQQPPTGIQPGRLYLLVLSVNLVFNQPAVKPAGLDQFFP
jgi:hypothetical protein